MISNFREKLRSILSMGEDPHKLAMAFAIGVFIAFSPLIGIHTLLALGVVWLFRYNPVATLAGAFVNNPWTFVPIYAGCLWLGMLIWPVPEDLPKLAFSGLGMGDFVGQFHPYLMPFVVGTTVAGLVAAVAGYWVMLSLVKTFQRSRKKASSEAATHPAPDTPTE
ncbi:MAG: DUF2062 domain-containing protein [Leptospirillia bacterium]